MNNNESNYTPLYANESSTQERDQIMSELESGHSHHHRTNTNTNTSLPNGTPTIFQRISDRIGGMFKRNNNNSKSASALSLPFATRIPSRLCIRFMIIALCISITLLVIFGISNGSNEGNHHNGSSQYYKSPYKGDGFFKNIFKSSSSVREILMANQLDTFENYAQEHLKLNISFKDFKEFAYRQRVYKQLFETYEENYSHIRDEIDSSDNLPIVEKDENDVEYMVENRYPMMPELWRLERRMFPWAHKRFYSLLEMKKSYKGRGIIIPTGDGHFRFAVHLIRTLKWLNCTLPIWIAFSGQEDLNPDQQLYLKRMNTTLFDLSSYIDTESLGLKGWQIKPFAMLVAPFEEVVIMDADSVWLQNPEIVFEDEGYKKHHAVIFHDRTLFEGDQGKRKWIHENIPPPLSSSIKSTRMYQMISAHEQDSGVVYWNKKKRFHSLLLSCKMNCKQERDEFFYKEFYGDKESFWIAIEMMQETYTDLWPTPGVMGKGMISKKTGEFVACGRILQFDRLGWPLWFNGGIVYHKHNDVLKNYINNFTHYAREGKWDFITECLDANVTALNGTIKNIFEESGKLFRVAVNLKSSPEEDFRDTLPPGLPTEEQIKAAGKL